MSNGTWTSWEFLMGQDAAGANTPTAAPAATGEAATPASNNAEKAASEKPIVRDNGVEGSSFAPPAGGSGGAGSKSPGGGIGDSMFLIVIALFFGFMIFMSFRGRKNQQKKFDTLYGSLKRGDRIMLNNGKFVTVERVGDDSIFVWADEEQSIREEYHKNAVASLAADVKNKSAKK